MAEQVVGEVQENFTPKASEKTRATIKRTADEGEVRQWVSFFLTEDEAKRFRAMLRRKGLKQYDWLRDIARNAVIEAVEHFEQNELAAIEKAEAEEAERKLAEKIAKQTRTKENKEKELEAKAQAAEAKAAAGNAKKGKKSESAPEAAPPSADEIEAALAELGIKEEAGAAA